MNVELRQADNTITEQAGVGAAALVIMQTAGPVTVQPPGLTGATVAIAAASGNVANTAAVATLAAAVGKTTYITGFSITSSGATVGAVVLATLAGLVGGVTFTYVYAVMAGAALGNATLHVDFAIPLPASAVNTAIVLTLPALGVGNTNAAVVIRGYQA